MLMKSSSKRKRTKEELEEVKQEEDAMRQDTQAYFQDVKRLKQEHAEMLALIQGAQIQEQMQADIGGQMAQQQQPMQFNI